MTNAMRFISTIATIVQNIESGLAGVRDLSLPLINELNTNKPSHDTAIHKNWEEAAGHFIRAHGQIIKAKENLRTILYMLEEDDPKEGLSGEGVEEVDIDKSGGG